MLKAFNNIGWSCYNCVKLNDYIPFFIMRLIQNLTISWETNFYDENTC
jgi:hypothetical protein